MVWLLLLWVCLEEEERKAPARATWASARTYLLLVVVVLGSVLRPYWEFRSTSISRMVNSTRSETLARASNGARQNAWPVISQYWRVDGSMRWIAFPTRVHTVRGVMLERDLACLSGIQTRSSLQMGGISTE